MRRVIANETVSHFARSHFTMPMSDTSFTTAPAQTPSHDEIAQYARELWHGSGRPTDRDEAIWFEAERQLITARMAPIAPVAVRQESTRPRSRARRTPDVATTSDNPVPR